MPDDVSKTPDTGTIGLDGAQARAAENFARGRTDPASPAYKEHRFRETFFDLATKYYVGARLVARAGLLPVHGNLFHHAVEMYLKGALVGTLPVEQMKKFPFIHDLTALWDRFKTKTADPAALARFDPTIRALHEFESIRYPDKIVDEGMIATVTWEPRHATTESGSAKMPPKYEFIIAEIDTLVIEVLRRASINPRFFSITMTGHAKEGLAHQNPQAAAWQ